MSIKTVILISVAVIVGLPLEAQKLEFVPKFHAILEIKHPAEFTQCSRRLPRNIKEFNRINESDLRGLQTNLWKVLNLTESVKGKPKFTVDSLKSFGFQFIGMNVSGKKYIYCNAFRISNTTDPHERYATWRTTLVDVCDGGYDFWGVLYDVKKHQFKNLIFNGGG